MPYNPGKLDRMVVMKYPTSSSIDRFGQSIMTYNSSSLWANVKKETGTETTNGGYIYNTATYKFILRNNSNISEKSVITYDSNDYNLVFVDKEPFKGYTTIIGERRN
jgi:SPP1 family predicted phage head-tail adaptor